MSSGGSSGSDTKDRHEPAKDKDEQPSFMNPFLIPDEEDYYDFDELDFETSPTIIHRGDLTDRVQRMRQVISDEDLDRALLGLVNIAEEDQSHGGDDILWVDLYISCVDLRCEQNFIHFCRKIYHGGEKFTMEIAKCF